VNIKFQQSWNLILLFVIVGLDPTIQVISDSFRENYRGDTNLGKSGGKWYKCGTEW
jgi:hypothetical protein